MRDMRTGSQTILCYTCLLFLSAVFLFGLPGLGRAVPDASGIMQQVAKRQRGNNVITQLEMTLVESNGHTRTRKLKIFSKEDVEKRQRILVFLEPASIAETALLVEDFKEDDTKDNQWIYLPALNKSKRIATDVSGESFMGSDFSYADLISRNHANFNYTLVKESVVESVPVWVIEAIPEQKDIAKDCGYTKALFLVRKDNHVVIRSVLWVYGKTTLKYIEVKKLEEVDGIWVPMETYAKTVDGKKVIHQTVLKVNGVSFENQFSDELFSVQRLERGF